MVQEDYEVIYNEAESKKSWVGLLNYPRLLFRYQRKHRDENIRIATVSSHILGHHVWCETKEKCFTVEEFLNKYGIKTV